MKKLLSILLCVCMVMTMIPMVVFADYDASTETGTAVASFATASDKSGITVTVTAKDAAPVDTVISVYVIPKTSFETAAATLFDNTYTNALTWEIFLTENQSNTTNWTADNFTTTFGGTCYNATISKDATTGTVTIPKSGLTASTDYYTLSIDMVAGIGNFTSGAFTTDANKEIPTPFAAPNTIPNQNVTVGVKAADLDLVAAAGVTGGSGTYTVTSTSALPAGMEIKNNKLVGTPTAVGTNPYNVTVSITDGEATAIEKSFTITVAKGTQTLTGLSDKIVKVDGTVELTVGGAKGAITATPVDGTKATVVVAGNKITVTGVAEGETTINVSAAETADYNAGTGSFKVTVQAASAPDITVTNNTHTYDGAAKTATVTATLDGAPVAEGDITVTYDGEAKQTNANESGYAIVVTIDGKTYNPTEKLVINKKALTISFTGNEAGKTLADVTHTLSGVVDGDTVTANITWTEVTGTKDVCDSEKCTEDCTCRDETPTKCTEADHNCQLGENKTAADFPLTAGSSHAYTVALTGTDAANYTLEDGTMNVPAPVSGGGGGVSNNFTVTYNAGSHGALAAGAKSSEQVKRNESPKNVPAVVANAGYAFIGWTADGKTLVDPAAQTITKNTTFTAVYGDHLNYMVGRSAMEFVPNGNLTRAEAAAILSRLTEGFAEDGTYPAAPYSDLVSGAWYVKYINFAADKGIVNGRTDGTFDPDANITRAEFATMIANFAKIAPVDTAAVSTDVAGHWAEGYIAALEQAKIVTGYEDGTFKPNNSITRAEAATMVNGAIGRVPMTGLDLSVNGYDNPFVDVNESQWFYGQVMEATVDHVTAHFHK